MWFALGVNKPRIGKLGKVVAIETSKALSSEIKATTISISTTEGELAGCTLANDGSSTDINGFTFDELKKNADARGFGILKGTVSNHDCPMQTECYECEGSGVCKDCQGSKRVDCVNCEGTGECPTCGGTQTVPCTVCGGDGKCTNCGGDGECPSCGGSGKEDCTVCDGDGELWCDA